MVEKIKSFIDSLLKTDKDKETAFNYIFYLTATVYLVNGLINAIDAERFSILLDAFFGVIQLGCLYVACLFFVRRENPNATTILAIVFASLTFLDFVLSCEDYGYYSLIYVIPDVVCYILEIGGAVLFVLYQLKKNKYEETGKIYEYILYAGVCFLGINVFFHVIMLFMALYEVVSSSYYGFGNLLKFILVNIVLTIPTWFLVLGVWLAVDLELERDLKNEYTQAETAEAVPAAIAEEPADERTPKQDAENNPKTESTQTGETKKERTPGSSPYSRLVAILLAWFLGLIGAHRFYVGKTGTGILMIVTLGGFGVWSLVDVIMIACGTFKDKDGLPLLDWQV